jgi:hypothetical protein
MPGTTLIGEMLLMVGVLIVNGKLLLNLPF